MAAARPRVPARRPQEAPLEARRIDPERLTPNPTSTSIYGDSSASLIELEESIRERGILVPLVVTPCADAGRWEILSGHRRWACARALGLHHVPCEIRPVETEAERQQLVLEYNRYRRKSFSVLMKEADLLEKLLALKARARSLANLRGGETNLRLVAEDEHPPDGRNSDDRDDRPEEGSDDVGRGGRTDVTVASQLGIGGKDLYRQARAIWKLAAQGDLRARNGVEQLDAGTKSIHAAYKDLRRRDRFAAGFQPTPYDVWSFRHDRAFGIPHPGAIPASIIAHAVHYFSPPGGLVVDPMAGGGTALDVCKSMGRRCLAYDLEPARPDVTRRDVRDGFPPECRGCDLIFCDPPYHTMLADAYPPQGVSRLSLQDWMAFLDRLAKASYDTLRPGGCLTLLLASQTEKDLPVAHGYIDHAFLGYVAATRAGFLPERRISCPMSGAYRPQQVRQARLEGRLLGQVRDLLVLRKPRRDDPERTGLIPYLQSPSDAGSRSSD